MVPKQQENRENKLGVFHGLRKYFLNSSHGFFPQLFCLVSFKSYSSRSSLKINDLTSDLPYNVLHMYTFILESKMNVKGLNKWTKISLTFVATNAKGRKIILLP